MLPFNLQLWPREKTESILNTGNLTCLAFPVTEFSYRYNFMVQFYLLHPLPIVNPSAMPKAFSSKVLVSPKGKSNWNQKSKGVQGSKSLVGNSEAKVESLDAFS